MDSYTVMPDGNSAAELAHDVKGERREKRIAPYRSDAKNNLIDRLFAGGFVDHGRDKWWMETILANEVEASLVDLDDVLAQFVGMAQGKAGAVWEAEKFLQELATKFIEGRQDLVDEEAEQLSEQSDE